MMMNQNAIRKNPWLYCAGLLFLGCSADVPYSGAAQGAGQDIVGEIGGGAQGDAPGTESALADSAAVGGASLAKPFAQSLRLSGMTARRDRKNGRVQIGLQVDAYEAQRLRDENGGKLGVSLVFPGSSGATGKGLVPDLEVDFTEVEGSGAAEKSNGVRSLLGFLPLNLQDWVAMIVEFNQLKERELVDFSPGGHEVVGRKKVDKIDLWGFLFGKTIDISALTRLRGLKALGANNTKVLPERSLMIRDLAVIEDDARTMNPCEAATKNDALKAWTFGRLMSEMAKGSGLSPSAFVEDWLDHWRAEQLLTDTETDSIILDAISDVAGDVVKTRVIDPWRARSGGGELDLRIAPFRLQAIFYRPDLANSSPYGDPAEKNGGELRFVFGVMDVRDANGDGDALDSGDSCNRMEAAAIFEYSVPLSGCTDIKNWANRFIELSEFAPAQAAFRDRLEGLTQEVVMHGSAPGKGNQNALNQLRTNEISLSGVWQFREFVIPEQGGALQQTTVKQNPREHVSFTATEMTPQPIDINASDIFLAQLKENLDDILNGNYQVPEVNDAGQPVLGGSSSYELNNAWTHEALQDNATPELLQGRFNFSVNTCSGCHTQETDTRFYHVTPSGPGTRAAFSTFLTKSGHQHTDVHGIKHEFDETASRRQALYNLANQVCLLDGGLFPFQLAHFPVRSVH